MRTKLQTIFLSITNRIKCEEELLYGFTFHQRGPMLPMTLLQIYTLFHTALSLVALIAGILVVKGLLESSGRQLWTLLFLVTSAATTITGFFFPFQGVTRALILGVITLLPLFFATLARYQKHLESSWRGTYVISVVIILYFNCLVLIVQSFDKIPSLHAMAPTMEAPAHKIAQLLNLIAFVILGIRSFKNYKPKRLDELTTGYVSPRAKEGGL